MAAGPDEEKLLRSVALQNAKSILAARQRESKHLADKIAQGERIAEPGKPRGHLDVIDPLRQPARLDLADPQVLAGRVHHDLDRYRTDLAAAMALFAGGGQRVVVDRAGLRGAIGQSSRTPLARFAAWSAVVFAAALGPVAIALSGLAGTISWLFGFKALASPGGDVSRVMPIDKLSVPLAAILAFAFLRERPSAWNWIGIVLIAFGAYLSALPRPTLFSCL